LVFFNEFSTQLFVEQARAIIKKGIQKNILAVADLQLALFSKGFVIWPTNELKQHSQIIHYTIIYYRIALFISIIK